MVSLTSQESRIRSNSEYSVEVNETNNAESTAPLFPMYSSMNAATTHSSNYLNNTAPNLENSPSDKQHYFNRMFKFGAFHVKDKMFTFELNQLLTDLGNLRSNIAKKNTEMDKIKFGKLRNSSSDSKDSIYTMLYDEHYQDTTSYNTHIPKVRTFVIENAQHIEADAFHYQHSFINMSEECGSIDTPEDKILLTLIGSIHNNLILYHTHTSQLKLCIQNLDLIFKSIKNSIIENDTSRAVNSIAIFTYLFNHAAPYKRGSASIGEMFSAGMLVAAGVSRNINSFKGMDFLAYRNTLETFIPKFKKKLSLNQTSSS